MQEKGFYLRINQSKYLLIYSLIMHLLAVVSVMLLSVSVIVKWVLVIGIFSALIWHIYRLGFLGHYHKQPSALINLADESWQLHYKDKSVTPNMRLESAWITRYSAIIRFRLPNQNRVSIVILNDAVDKELFRQLRVRLKLAFYQQ